MPTKFNTVPCKGCGKPIVWAKDEKGSNIPCDPRPAVYEVSFNGANEPYFAKRAPESMVTHFATCPEVAYFSKSRKESAGEAGLK